METNNQMCWFVYEVVEKRCGLFLEKSNIFVLSESPIGSGSQEKLKELMVCHFKR